MVAQKKVADSSRGDTRRKILDAAEKLFAREGFASTSVRAITSAAGVNLAALNYHFGSKDALIEAVFKRRLQPLNQERLRLLREARSEAGESRPLSVSRILESLLGPPLRLAHDAQQGEDCFMRLMGRSYTEPGEFFREHIAQHFEEVFRHFDSALREALPEISSEDRFWKLHFILGSMTHTMGHALGRIHEVEIEGDQIRFGSAGPEDVDKVLRRLIDFAQAGLQGGIGERNET